MRKALLIIAVVLSALLVVMSVKPSNVNELNKPVHMSLSSSTSLDLNHDFRISGMALSGSWEGPGFAQVWLIAKEGEKFMLFDTRNLPRVLELSLGTPFEKACAETCNIPPVLAESLLVIISGPGVLNIDSYHFTVSSMATGLMVCPGCKKAKMPSTPDHSVLLLVVMLLIGLFGSHTLHHCCRNPIVSRFLILVFFSSFLMLAGVFGKSLLSPTGMVTGNFNMAASVFAAFGVLALMIIGVVEILNHGSRDNG